MEKYFALIKANIVQHIVVADESFVQHAEKDYDHVVEVTDNRPQPGDSYYPLTKTFINNQNAVHNIGPDLPAPKLDFEPFNISKYTVSHEDGYIVIGCKKYSAAGFIEEVRKIAERTQHTTSTFTSTDEGPTHGKFGVTWGDVQKIYEIVIKDK